MGDRRKTAGACAAAALMLLAAAPARAADGFAGPVYDWNGAYAGVNGGYATGTQSQGDGFEPGSGDRDIAGFFAGGELGAQMQVGSVVLGVESDLQYAAIGGDFKGSDRWGCGSQDCATDVDWFGTTRMRAGYSVGRFLPYLTGGVAYGTIRSKAGNGPDWRLDDTVLGWTAGAGLDVALTENLSGRFEYLYVDLGRTGNSGNFDFNAAARFNLLRVGLNYKL